MILLQLIYNLLTCIERTGKFIFCSFIQIRHRDLNCSRISIGIHIRSNIKPCVQRWEQTDAGHNDHCDWIVSQPSHIPF